MIIDVKSKTKNTTHLAIQGEMTIYTASEQKRALAEYLANCGELQIDLSGVDEIDSAGLQILMFLKRETVTRRINLSLIRHSQAVVEVMELLNLTKHFGDPIILSANWKSS